MCYHHRDGLSFCHKSIPFYTQDILSRFIHQYYTSLIQGFILTWFPVIVYLQLFRSLCKYPPNYFCKGATVHVPHRCRPFGSCRYSNFLQFIQTHLLECAWRLLLRNGNYCFDTTFQLFKNHHQFTFLLFCGSYFPFICNYIIIDFGYLKIYLKEF